MEATEPVAAEDETAEAEKPAEVFEAVEHEDVVPSEFSTPTAEPVVQAGLEAEEPVAEEPWRSRPRDWSSRPPSRWRKGWKRKMEVDAVPSEAAEERDDTTEPIAAAGLATAVAGVTQPLAVWPVPEELESWPSRAPVQEEPVEAEAVLESVVEEAGTGRPRAGRT